MRGRLCGRGNFFFSVSTDVFVREIGTPRPRDRGLPAKRRRETKTGCVPKRRGDSMLRRAVIRAAAALVATTATAAATTAVAEPASPPYRRAKPPRDSPFSYRELDEAVARRRDQERALATYVNTVAPMIASARGRWRARRSWATRGVRARARAVRDARRARAAETAALTWGDVPDGQKRRAEFVERYGCVGWTDAALAEIAKHAPIVEMGAGRGQWQRALAERGVDVLAYDDRSAVPGTNEPRPPDANANDRAETRSARKRWGVTRRGDETKLRSFWATREADAVGGVPGRRLVGEVSGELRRAVVLFVGEGRGGVNGSRRRRLRRNADVENAVPVKPFGDGHEKLWVLRRKRTSEEQSASEREARGGSLPVV